MEWSRVRLDKYSGILLAMLMQRRLGRSLAAPGCQVIRQNPSATLVPSPSQLFNRLIVLRKTTFFYIKISLFHENALYLCTNLHNPFNVILLHTLCNKICLSDTASREINTVI